MKNPILKMTILTFTLLLLISTISCCNDDENNNDPTSQLPAATQTGANTAGCLVNGEPLTPAGGGVTPNLVCHYQFINGEYYFSLGFFNQNENNLNSLNLEVNKIQLTNNHLILLNKNSIDNPNFIGGSGMRGFSQDPLNGITYSITTSQHTGELTITHLDTNSSIISGTFWFDAVNADGEVVEIREGRFDMHYTN